MSFDKRSNSIEKQNDSNRMQINESSEDDHADEDVHLEEGEIEDDDELVNQQEDRNLHEKIDDLDNKSLSSSLSEKSTEIKQQRKHKKRNRKKNRDKKRQRKNRPFIDFDKINEFDQENNELNSRNNSDEPPLKLSNNTVQDSQKPMISLAQPLPNIPQITPLLNSLPLVSHAPLLLPNINPLIGQHQTATVKSLLDLITISSSNNNNNNNNNNHHFTSLTSNTTPMIQSSMITSNASFIDPIQIEKENNKPNNQKRKRDEQQQLLQQQQQQQQYQGELSKKQEKKRKYIELMREKQKRDEERKLKQETKEKTIVCKFYLEGRCQKGDECTFSHNAKPNKKYEICKYYLNGYCSKNEMCVYMHSEFPCKFYHTTLDRKCSNGDKCRFSHEPILDQQTRDAFDKYLKDTNSNAGVIGGGGVQSTSLTITPVVIEIPGPNNNKQSILGSPPRHLKAEVEKRFQQSKQSQLPPPPPTSHTHLPLVLQTQTQFKPNFVANTLPIAITQPLVPIIKQPNYVPFSMQDVDERGASTFQASSDVDERVVVSSSHEPQSNSILKLFEQQQQQQQQEQPMHTKIVDNKNDDSYDEDEDEEANTLNIDEFCELNGLDVHENYEYNLPPIDVQPSSLWSKPPVHLSSSLSNNSSNAECDPRVEFYSNKSNNPLLNSSLKTQIKVDTLSGSVVSSNLNDSLQSAMSPPPPPPSAPSVSDFSNTNSAHSKKSKIDPRLSAKQKQQQQQQQQQQIKIEDTSGASTNDLLNLLSRQQNPLISSLPDFKAPPVSDPRHLIKSEFTSTCNTTTQLMHNTHDTNLTRLSIDDYKRKLSRSTANCQQSSQAAHVSSYAPQIPSYSANLVDSLTSDYKPPQSLHEMLKNLPS